MTQVIAALEKLGPKLTSTTISEREDALNELTALVTGCRKDEFSENEISLLLEFYCARLQDSVVLLNATLNGLTFLCSANSFPSGAASNAVSAIFKDQQIQSLAFDNRRSIYLLLCNLLRRGLPGLREMGSEFVMNFIQCIDGERDPRNLIIVFELHQIVSKNFELGPFVDELFDVVACYFPIDFSANNETMPIKVDDLSVVLRSALTAVRAFAPGAFNLVLENISGSSSAKAKQEALLLLRDALDAFSAESTVRFSASIWSSLRPLLLAPIISDIENIALDCLKSLVKSLEWVTTDDGKNSALVHFLGQLTKDFDPFLTNPEMSLLLTSNKILLNSAMAGGASCKYLGSVVLPLIMERMQCSKSPAEYEPLYIAWLEFFISVGKDTALHILQPISAAVCSLLKLMLTKPENSLSRSFALRGISALLQINDSVIDATICNDLWNLIVQNCSDSCTLESTKAVFLFGVKKWNWLEESGFLNRATSMSADETIFDGSPNCFIWLPFLIHNQQSYDRIMPAVLSHFKILSTTDSLDLFSNLCGIIERVWHWDSVIGGNVECKWLQTFWTDIIVIAFEPLNVESEDIQQRIENFLKDRASILGAALQNLMLYFIWKDLPGMQDVMLESFVTQLLHILNNIVGEGADTVAFTDISKPLSNEFCSAVLQLGILSKLLVLPLSRWIAALPAKCIDGVFVEAKSLITSKLINCLELGLHFDTDETLACALQLSLGHIAAVVCNKASTGASLTAFVERLQSVFEKPELFPTESITFKDLVLKQHMLVTKALLLRNLTPFSLEFSRKMISMLDTADGCLAVNCFEMLFKDEAEFFSSKLHSNVTFLYKQRIFTQLTPLLLQEFKKASSEHKLYFFQAVSSLLVFASQSSKGISSELPTLLPVLLESVYSSEYVIVRLSLSSLKQLLQLEVTQLYFQENNKQLLSLIEHLLVLCTVKADQKLRLASLDALKTIAAYPVGLVFPCREKTIRELVRCLDDHKRNVRMLAADTRNLWILMGQ